MRTIPFSVATLVCSGILLPAQDFEKLSRSDLWQVRYCVSGEFRTPTPRARTVLERLADDSLPAVARQAFAVYSSIFVDVKKGLPAKAFQRGDFDIDGADLSEPDAFRKPGYWRAELATVKDEAIKGRAVRALGLLGDTAVLPDLAGLAGSTNPYLLAELAKACRRLGDDKQYLAVIDRLLALPVKESLHYQTQAVGYLIQTHPDRARPAWERIEKELAGLPDLQPGWVYAHFLLKDQLP